MSTKHLLLFLLLSTMVQELSAGSFIGGDVRYRHLGAKQYEVTVAVYRDCRGIGLNSPPRAIVYNDSFEILLSLTRVKIEEIKGSACAGGCVTNTPSNQGDEKHTFLDTVNFATGAYALFGTQARPLVYFGFEQCCRNSAITTYAPGNMFVEAMLNLYYAKQNSAIIGFNDFLFPAETYLSCQQTHNTSYRTLPFQSNDSQVYEMVRAKEDKNTEAVYDPYKPLTYYCGSPNTFTCQSNTLLNPARGFFFNSSNGNLITTPANCAEVGTMVCRVSIFRRSGNTSVLVGYMKRDYNFIVTPTPGERVPYILKNKDYTIKAREQFCADIPVKDDKDALQAQADTVLIAVVKAPVYGKLSLLDSNAREKTMHYCWTPTDADYLSNKRDEFIINGDQKKCLMMKKRGISTTIQFQVVAPDSLCTITVRTYEDKNKNGKKDGKETYSQALFFTQQKSVYTPYYTDSSGSLVIRPFYGQFALGIQEQLEIIGAKVPVGLNARFDSSYVIELGYFKRPGIKGRVYEDKNNNCVFDGNDVPLAQQKVVADNLNRMAFTDSKGYYFIQTSSGNITLKLASTSAYQATCNSSYQVAMPKDSVILNKDFAVRKRSNFKDLSVEIVTKSHVTQNQILSQDIKITNNGFTTQKYVTVKLVSNRRLPEFKSTLTSYKTADTFLWVLDSIRPLSSRSIPFDLRMNTDTFKKGESICYTAWLRADSVLFNNSFSICESIIDSAYVPQLKLSMNPLAVSDYDKTLCYQLSYTDKSANHNFLIFKDTLDSGIFDLNSLTILTTTPGLKVNLLDNVLLADYSGNFAAGTEIFVRYAIALKTPFTNSFAVRNTAYVKADNDNAYQWKTVVNTTQSALFIEALTDTVYCAGDWVYVPVRTRFAPDKFYQCRILLSDSSSRFTVPVILKDTLINKVYTILPVRLPSSTLKGQGYQLKVVLTNVSYSSFESDFKQTLQVHSLPVAALNSNLRNGFICSGDTLKTMASGADSVLFFYNTYQVNSLSTQKSFNFVPNANGQLQVVVKDINGCADSSEVLPFKLHQLPNIQLTSAPELCYGDSLNITVSGAQQYDWYVNNNLIKSGTDTIINSGALTVKTTYKVRGTDAKQCSNTDSVKVLVNPLPLKPQLYAEKARFYSSYPLRNQWYLNQVKIDTGINQYYYPPVYGLYQVEYTDLKGCKSKSETYEYKYVSITAATNLTAITVYPNPFNNYIVINNPSSDNCFVDVMNIEGQVLSKALPLDLGSAIINSSDWPTGVYVLVFYNQDHREVIRLVKTAVE